MRRILKWVVWAFGALRLREYRHEFLKTPTGPT